MTKKEELYQYCQQNVQQRVERIRFEIKSIQQSANEETKSSAGDKYETSRSMAQLEIDRNIAQLRETEKLLSSLKSFRSDAPLNRIQAGSLVTTSNDIFYIAISLGSIKLNGQIYFVVSPDSPIAKLLLNKQVGEFFVWNGVTRTVISIE